MTVTFEELGVDIIPNIFKYLSLVERVKYERISKDVRCTLFTLWRNQSRLMITDAYDHDVLNGNYHKCFIKAHTFHECEIINLEPVDESNWEIITRELLKRSPKLKSLTLDVYKIGEFYEKLKLPLTVEHLASWWFDKLEINNETLVCVLDLMDENDRLHDRFLLSGPDFLEPKLPNILYMHRPGVNYIRTLKITDFEEATREVELSKFLNLREVSMTGMDHALFHSLDLRLCPNLQRLSIEWITNEGSDEWQNSIENVTTVIKRYGKQLKHFEFLNSSHGDSVIDKIDLSLMANTLEELSLIGGSFDFRRFEHYKFGFPRLRKLKIHSELNEWSGFPHVLEKSPKLRYLDLNVIFTSAPFQEVVAFIDKFANEHPKRRITLISCFGDEVDFNIITSGLIIKKYN